MQLVKIEKAQPEDAQEIINFLNSVGGETDYLTFGLNEFPISVAEEVDLIKECLAKDNSLMLVAKIDNKIASQLFLDVSMQPRLSHIGHLGLTVSKVYWGNALGKMMLAAAIDWAREKKLTKIQLQVRTDNLRAINLYKNFHFTIEGTIKQALKVNHVLYDDLVMGLDLLAPTLSNTQA
ncbi:MAG: GNAT family N-acetyltransferase [Legionella sp.]